MSKLEPTLLHLISCSEYKEKEKPEEEGIVSNRWAIVLMCLCLKQWAPDFPCVLPLCTSLSDGRTLRQL